MTTVFAIAAVIVIFAVGVTLWIAGRSVVAKARERRLTRQATTLTNALARLRAEAYVGIDQVLFEMRDLVDPRVIERELRRELDDAAERPAALISSFRLLGYTDRYLVEVRAARGWRDRARAAASLGLLREPRAVRPLVEAMRDPHEDGDVKLACAEALGQLRDPSVIPGMCELLADVDEWASPRLAQVLRDFGAAAVQPLLAVLDRSDHLNARVWAAQILGRIGDSRATWPLVERLHDRAEQLRLAATNALAELRDGTAVPPLIGVVLRDPVAAVRAQAARALGELGDDRALPLLIASLGDPDYWMRFRALEAIEALAPADTTPIENALADANPEVRRRAVLALERMGKLEKPFGDLASDDDVITAEAERRLVAVGRAGLAERLIRHLAAPDARTRGRIARVLGQVGEPRHTDALIAALADADSNVTLEVIHALGALATPSAAAPLIDRLVSSAQRSAIAGALRQFDGGVLATHLARLTELAAHPSDDVRVAALRVIAAVRDPAASAVLLTAMTDRHGDARFEAATALGQRARMVPSDLVNDVADALAAGLADSSDRVRVAAADALGLLGGARAVEHLLTALPRAEAVQRDAICRHLAELGFEALAPAIDVLLASADDKARIGLAWTLGKTADRRALPLLIALRSSPDAALRASATGALAKIMTPEATAALVATLDDPSPFVRSAAVNGLGRRGPEVADAIARALDDPDAFVRRRAAIALARAGGEPAGKRLLSVPRDAIAPAALLIALALSGAPAAIGEATLRLRDRQVARDVDEMLAGEDDAVRQGFREKIRPRASRVSVLADEPFRATQLLTEQAASLRDAVDPTERRRSAIALARVLDDASVRALADAVRSDPDVDVRRESILAFASAPSHPAVREAVMVATRDPDPQVRATALRTAGSFVAPADAGPLLDALRATDPVIRTAAEEALATVFVADLDALHDWLMAQTEEAVIAAAIRAIGRIGAAGSLAALQAQLRAASPIVRGEAIAALARLATPSALGAVISALADPVEGVRLAAVHALALASRSDVIEALAAVIYDPSIEVRVTLATTLATLTSTRSVELLAGLTGDASPRVAARAALGLLIVPDDEGLEVFLARHPMLTPDALLRVRNDIELVIDPVRARLIGSLDPRIRRAAARVLGAVDPLALADVLALALRDPDPTVRIAAIEGLAAAGADKISDRLRAVLEDPVGDVRTAARRALMRPV